MIVNEHQTFKNARVRSIYVLLSHFYDFAP